MYDYKIVEQVTRKKKKLSEIGLSTYPSGLYEILIRNRYSHGSS